MLDMMLTGSKRVKAENLSAFARMVRGSKGVKRIVPALVMALLAALIPERMPGEHRARDAERRAKTQLRAAKIAHGALPCRRREGRHVPHGRKRRTTAVRATTICDFWISPHSMLSGSRMLTAPFRPYSSKVRLGDIRPRLPALDILQQQRQRKGVYLLTTIRAPLQKTNRARG